MAVGYKVKPELFVDKEFKSRELIDAAVDWRGVVQMANELQGEREDDRVRVVGWTREGRNSGRY